MINIQVGCTLAGFGDFCTLAIGPMAMNSNFGTLQNWHTNKDLIGRAGILKQIFPRRL